MEDFIYSWITDNIKTYKPIIVELGAHIGWESKWFYHNLMSPFVICVEPDPRNIQAWLQNCAGNNAIDSRFTQFNTMILLPYAISDKDGSTILNISDSDNNWDFSSTIKKPKEHLVERPDVNFDKTVEVKTVCLDSLYDFLKIQIVELLWVDIEGAEHDMIIGGQDALKKTKYLYIEYNPIEYYHGAMNLEQTICSLPDFQMIEHDSRNILFRNKELIK